MQNRIFSTDSAKAVKAGAFGYINAIHYLAPADLSGFNLCPHASAGCTALCLGWTSGQAGMVKHDADINSVRASRIAKSKRFMKDRVAYMKDVVRSIELLQAKAEKVGKRLCVRMNGSSDIGWQGVSCVRNGQPCRNLFVAFPEVAFVDYTKDAKRALVLTEGPFTYANYHLTFSRSETNEDVALKLLARGVNVAVVFANKPAHGSEWKGYMVIDGDEHDLRQLDPRGSLGYVIALSPKGSKAKKDLSGFVVR